MTDLINLSDNPTQEDILGAIKQSDGLLIELLRDRTWDGNLYLTEIPVVYIPEGLVVNGNMRLCWCDRLEILPKNMVVKGDLNLCGCVNLKELPDGLHVYGDLNIMGCNELRMGNIRVQKSIFSFDGDVISKSGIEPTPYAVPVLQITPLGWRKLDI